MVACLNDKTGRKGQKGTKGTSDRIKPNQGESNQIKPNQTCGAGNGGLLERQKWDAKDQRNKRDERPDQARSR
jgi:hypothetical protein